VPASRWSVDAYYDQNPETPGKINTRWGGFLDDIAGFDPNFFGISPREAKQMDPQQRLALELCWEGLEDAQIAPGSLRGSRTGVFFGSMWEEYARLCTGAQAIVQHTATGQNSSILPARVSYTLGLNGPSLVVNTACSSSLVAVHLACQSLLWGESKLCLVGGVNLILSPESSIAMSKFGGLSPDGRSRAFDARANGYVRGEGGGVVVLKRLSHALEDGDRIYCVIRNSAVNNDGFSNGLTAPNPLAQQAVLHDAYAGARIAPDTVEYIEAHGTGTMLGDPIEAGALGEVLCAGRNSSSPLRIGSVKTNIGHLEAAAGVAGLIKVALSMEHNGIPSSLHFETPNPHIAFAELKLEVQTQLRPWMARNGRLIAGVSSFGFGGTNCHVVLEGHSPEQRPRVVFVFGGHGAQWCGMGRELAAKEPAAYDMLLRCDRAMQPYVGWSLLEQLERADEAQFERTEFAQPAIFAIEVALAEVWRCRGIVPDAVVGQSIGEVAAAYVAGALSLEDAVCVICRSSALISAHASGGATALIGLGRGAVWDRLADVAGRVSIAGVSAPEQTVVSGEADAVDALIERVAEDGVFARRARMGYASHSSEIEIVLPELARDFAGIVPQTSAIPFYSTVTGGRIDGDTLDASYWLKNLREMTLLEPVLTQLAEQGSGVFVELSPHAVLARAIGACAEAAGVKPVVVASGLHDEGEPQTLRRAHRRLFDAGLGLRRPENLKNVDANSLPALFVLSAKTEEATRAQAQQLRDYLVAHPALALDDIARSLAIGRDSMSERFAVVASSRESLVRAFERVIEGGSPARAHRGRAAGSPAKVAFLFTGQGAQVPGMGRELHGRWPVFRDAFDRCIEGFDRAQGRSLREVMWAEAGSPKAKLLHRTDYTQPALFTLEYALYAQWRAWGVEPDFLIDHSIGELVAACVAGVFSLEDAIRLVAARGTLMQTLPEGGAMASIEAPESEVVTEIAAWSGQVAIAAINTPQQIVISGVREAVEQVTAAFASRGRRTKSL
ncbi:MAG: type I polyketide synthase, partial [Nannocystaceae bacterium]